MHGRCQRWGVRELKHLPEGAAPAASRMTQSYTAGVTRIVSGPGVADNASGMRDLFDLTAEQRQVREQVGAPAREGVRPAAAQGDETEAYPPDQLTSLGEQGLMGLYIPEAYGGAGLGALAFCLAVEEIAWAGASTAVIYLVQSTGGFPIVTAGSEAQKRRYLPRLAAGEITAAFSLSEPGAGSDAGALTTTAVRRGDRYLLNGTKMWVTNGSHAGVITLFATVDRGKGHRGVTAFLVEPTFPGFALGKLERKLGIRGSPTVALHLSDCEVPVENRLGDEGEGFRIALRVLDGSRPAVGAQAVGIAQAALDAAVAYAKERQQFGQPIAAFQGIQFMLADMAMQTHGARLMVHHAAALLDRADAGRALADALVPTPAPPFVVGAIPRGGVTVALPLVERFRAPLALVYAGKLTAAVAPEFAFGALDEDGEAYVKAESVAMLGLSPAEVEQAKARVRGEIQRRMAAYGARSLGAHLPGPGVVLVDDGLATGLTMRVALAYARRHGARDVTVAVPCASAQAAGEFERAADRFVSLVVDPEFQAVGQYYLDFSPVPDDEVRAMLACG